MARPRKPLSWHLLTNNYRPSRHGPMPGQVASPPEPATSPPEPKIDPATAAWHMIFECGHHFFVFEIPHLIDPAMRPPGLAQDVAEAAFLRAVRSAWQRLGVAFMAAWKPSQFDDEEPWALRVFGDPSGPLKNPRRLRR